MSNVQGHEGFLERILHRHEHHHRKNSDESHPKHEEDLGSDEHKHKEGVKDKFKDYLRWDKELERKGDHYGGLM